MKSRLLLLQILSYASNLGQAQDCSTQTISTPDADVPFGAFGGYKMTAIATRGSQVKSSSTHTMDQDFNFFDNSCPNPVTYNIFEGQSRHLNLGNAEFGTNPVNQNPSAFKAIDNEGTSTAQNGEAISDDWFRADILLDDNERCSGINCEQYRGYQTKTLSGNTCLQWSDVPEEVFTTIGINRHIGGLDENFCRNNNPFSSDPNFPKTIWCFSDNQTYRMQACEPIQLDPGYYVERIRVKLINQESSRVTMQNVEVSVSGVVCNSLPQSILSPDDSSDTVFVEVYCVTPLLGTQIQLTQPVDANLELMQIEVWGWESQSTMLSQDANNYLNLDETKFTGGLIEGKVYGNTAETRDRLTRPKCEAGQLVAFSCGTIDGGNIGDTGDEEVDAYETAEQCCDSCKAHSNCGGWIHVEDSTDSICVRKLIVDGTPFPTSIDDTKDTFISQQAGLIKYYCASEYYGDAVKTNVIVEDHCSGLIINTPSAGDINLSAVRLGSDVVKTTFTDSFQPNTGYEQSVCPVSYTVFDQQQTKPLTLVNASQINTMVVNNYGFVASNALIPNSNSYSMTSTRRAGDWLRAEVDGGPKWINQVLIMHRYQYDLPRQQPEMMNVVVTVDGVKCGAIPNEIDVMGMTVVDCYTPLLGTEIQLTQVADQIMTMNTLEAYGWDAQSTAFEVDSDSFLTFKESEYPAWVNSGLQGELNIGEGDIAGIDSVVWASNTIGISTHSSIQVKDKCMDQIITAPSDPYTFKALLYASESGVVKSTNKMSTDFTSSIPDCTVEYSVFNTNIGSSGEENPRFKLVNPSMTDFQEGSGPANGVDGILDSMVHTNTEKTGNYFKTEFEAIQPYCPSRDDPECQEDPAVCEPDDGSPIIPCPVLADERYVSAVKISHVANFASMMQNVQITVSGVLCGALPDVIADGEPFTTVTCKVPLYGKQIQLTQVADVHMIFTQIEVFELSRNDYSFSIDSDGYLTFQEQHYDSGEEEKYTVYASNSYAAASQSISVIEKCPYSTLDVNTESQWSFSAHKSGSVAQVSSTTVTSQFTNSNAVLCPVTFTLEKNDGSSLDGGLENVVSINSDDKVSINESQYDGSSVSVRVKAATDFESVYKTITIENRCGSQTSTVKSDPDTEIQGVSTIDIERGMKPRSYSLSTFFTNSDEANCHYSQGAYSLVQVMSFVDAEFTNSLISIVNPTAELATAELAVDLRNYEGGADDIVFKIKYVSWFNYPTPLYYTVTLRDSCKRQTIEADSADAYTFSATRLKYDSPYTTPSELLSETEIRNDFTIFPLSGCTAIEWSLVNQSGGELEEGIKAVLAITDEGKLRVREGMYFGGQIDAQVKAKGEFTEGFKPILVTEQCGKQTIGVYDSSVELCGEDDKCEAYRGKQTKTKDGQTCTPWMEGLWDLDLVPFDPTVNTEDGLDDNYCRNPQKQFKSGDIWCYTLSGEGENYGACDLLQENAYSLEAVKQSDQTVLSSTKPKDDFTNSNPSGCPITFSIVDSEGEELEAPVAAFISINADGNIAVNESKYPGGIDLSLQVKAITDFGTPVFKPLTIHEKCSGQTLTFTDSVYTLEAVKQSDQTVLSQTKPKDDFENSNAIACPITFSIVNSEGEELEQDVAAFISINADGNIAVDETFYPGGIDLSLQVKALTEFGTPVFKTITVIEKCGRQTLTATDSELAYTLEARREQPGLVMSSAKPVDNFTNSNTLACPITFSIVDSEGGELEADVATFISMNADGLITVDESKYPGKDHSLQVKAITDFGTPIYMSITVIEICGRQAHTVTDYEKVYELRAISGKPGLVLSTTKPEDDITNDDPSVCPTTWSIVQTNGDALSADIQSVLSINSDGFVQVNQENFDGVNFQAKVQAINPVFNEPVFSDISITRQWSCREQTRTVSGGDFNFDPENSISDSACVESCTTKWETCSANSDQSCFTLTEKVNNLGDWDSTYKCALTDDDSFDNFLVAFTSNIANIQVTLNVLPEAQQNEVIACMKQVSQPETSNDPSFAEQQQNLDKTVNGFYSCLLLQDLLTDVYLDEGVRLYAPEDGFCGPAQGTTKGEYEWGEDAVFLACAYPLCCGFAIPKGGSDSMTRVSTCSGHTTTSDDYTGTDQFVYKPERVLDYERTIGTSEWDFTCSNIDGATILSLAMNVLMLSMSVFIY